MISSPILSILRESRTLCAVHNRLIVWFVTREACESSLFFCVKRQKSTNLLILARNALCDVKCIDQQIFFYWPNLNVYCTRLKLLSARVNKAPNGIAAIENFRGMWNWFSPSLYMSWKWKSEKNPDQIQIRCVHGWGGVQNYPYYPTLMADLFAYRVLNCAKRYSTLIPRRGDVYILIIFYDSENIQFVGNTLSRSRSS